MYPGDANNDGIANHFDLLPVGVAYGTLGPQRPGATLDWVRQPAPSWEFFLPVSGIDLAFVDGNGFSIIDELDIVPIANNYDNTQNDAFPPPADYLGSLTATCANCPCPELQIVIEKDTVQSTDTIHAWVLIRYVGTVPDSLGALGIALTLSYDYDSEKIVDSLTLVFPDMSPNNRMHVIATHTQATASGLLPQPGNIEFAAAGRGQNVFVMSDTLFTVRFIILDEIIRRGGILANEYFSLEIDPANVLILNRDEERICLGGIFKDSVFITSSISGPQRWQRFVHLSPNPVNDMLTIESPEIPIDRVDIRNVHGQHMVTKEADGQNRLDMSVSALTSGIWLAVVQTEKGVAVKKFVKAK